MDETERSNWSNPVMWLLIGLPVVSMIFGIGLVVIANRDSDDAIVDTVQRTGQMQTADLTPDAVAGQRALSAVVRIGKGTVDVIPVKGDFNRRASLKLSLLHPAHSADDKVMTLMPSETGWHAQHDVDLGSEWNVRLEAIDGHWRIAGRLPKGQRAALLQPALGGGG
ncbi:nitrogen fixation protein FixH [Lysobacter sp. TY2-98]|uniref:FixH family protein n=1 Tax=Lysobacter sp. TY2-98 TaxID=2290922 RepID=UPI000E203565|nr:FixH family protein [Lysobacter sp. TY2-98]AXK71644.1 nitrogen fixation protein FixH [Lysobacter sp. TY2-98]